MSLNNLKWNQDSFYVNLKISYPKFCSFKYLDSSLEKLDAECIYEVGLGDELCGQEDAFKKWFTSVLKRICIDTDLSFIQ